MYQRHITRPTPPDASNTYSAEDWATIAHFAAPSEPDKYECWQEQCSEQFGVWVAVSYDAWLS